MANDEKSAWIAAGLAVVMYAAYAVIVLGRTGDGTSLREVAYVGPMLVIVGVSIAVSIVAHIVIAATSPGERGRRDQRDKEIHRLGEYMGQGFLVAGAVAALLMAMAEWDHFWIANVIFLAFPLSAVCSSLAKIAAYRYGFQEW